MFIFGVNTAFVVKRQIFDLINVFAGQTDLFNGGLPGSLGAGGFSLGGNQRLAVAFFYPVRIIFVLILISVFVNRFGRLRPGKVLAKASASSVLPSVRSWQYFKYALLASSCQSSALPSRKDVIMLS